MSMVLRYTTSCGRSGREIRRKDQRRAGLNCRLDGFLTLAYDSMKQTIAVIKNAGLRDKVKIMIGGGQITEE